MTNTDIQVTSYRAVKKFLGYVAIYDHDMLDLVPDVVEVRYDYMSELLFRAKPEDIISFAELQGYKFSWLKMGAYKINEPFYATGELIDWVAEVLALIKANDIRFTHISQ